MGISSILSSNQLDPSVGLSQRQLTWLCLAPSGQLLPCLLPLSASPHPRMPLPSNQWLNLCHHMLCHLNRPCLIPRPTTSHWWTLKCFENLFTHHHCSAFWNWFWSNSFSFFTAFFVSTPSSTLPPLGCYFWNMDLLPTFDHSCSLEYEVESCWHGILGHLNCFSIWPFFPLPLLLNCLYSSNARIYSCIYIFFLDLWICLFVWNSLLFPLQPSLLTLTLTFKMQFKFHIP